MKKRIISFMLDCSRNAVPNKAFLRHWIGILADCGYNELQLYTEDTFQVEKGIRLATYASCCIENELLMLFRSEKKMARDVSLLEPIGADKEGNEICLLDIIESEPVNVAEQMDMRNNIQKLGIFMKRVLSKREQDILILRYGLFGRKEMTQREIAVQMGISRSYVSRIEKKALKKLRNCYELEGEEIK